MSSSSRDGTPATYPGLDRSAVLNALVPAERRRIVAALLDLPSPVDERALAAQLVADDEEAPVAAVVDSAAATAVHGTLRHVHLPALADAGLVTWDELAGTVAPTDHPGLGDPLIHRFVRNATGEWEAVVDALANRRRRLVLAVLQDAAEPVQASELARDVSARSTDRPIDHRDVLVSLQHAHLPKLDDAGLIDFDRETDSASYEGHPTIEGPWFGWWGTDRTGPDTSLGSTGDTTNHDPE